MKVKVISLPYIFQVLYVLCFTRPRYQVSVYRTIGPLVFKISFDYVSLFIKLSENGNNSFTSLGLFEIKKNDWSQLLLLICSTDHVYVHSEF